MILSLEHIFYIVRITQLSGILHDAAWKRLIVYGYIVMHDECTVHQYKAIKPEAFDLLRQERIWPSRRDKYAATGFLQPVQSIFNT